MHPRRFIHPRVPSSALLVCALVACAGGADDPSTDAAGHSGAHAELDDDFKGCPEGFPNDAPGLTAMGEHLAVNIVGAMPEEPERHINGWTVELSTLDGSPVADATIVRGETFMPVHGHDGGVQPQLKALADPGAFRVDRLNFTMRGPWEVRFWLRSASTEEDYAVFKVCVAK